MDKRIKRYVLAVFAVMLSCIWGIRTEASEPLLRFDCEDSVRMAAGQEKIISVDGAENVISGDWKVSNPSALVISEKTKGSVKIKAGNYVGNVTLTYSYTYKEEPEETSGPEDGSETEEPERQPEIKSGERSIQIFISNPALSASTVYLSVKSSTQNYSVVTVTGLNENSSVEVSGAASGIYAYTGVLRQNVVNQQYEADVMVGASSAKDAALTITVDGKPLSLHVIALSLSFNRTTKTVGDCYSNVYVNKQKAVFNESMSMLALYNGSSAKIKLSGSKTYPVKWKSSKSSVASVSGSGTTAVVKGKSKTGYATITATVAGKLTITYQVGVAKKAAIQTLLRGEKVAGAKYSQAKRMSSGYYDCSSFVWRMYKQSGVKFGVASGWAPTAASEAYYAASHYKIISWSNYDESKMLPGDILFYSSKKNGRFMNITHVAMYIKPGTRIDAHIVPSYHVGERPSTSLDVVMAVRPTSGKTTKVTSLKAAAVNKKSITLSWSPANSVTGYKVYKYNSTKKKYVLYKKLSYKKDKCKISDLKAGTTYKFKVCAYKGKRNYTASKISVKTAK